MHPYSPQWDRHFCGGFAGFGRRKSEGRLKLNTDMIRIEQGDVFVFVCPEWNHMNSKSVTLLKGTEGKERTEIYPKKGWRDVNVKCLSLKFEQLWTWEKYTLVWERPMWESTSLAEYNWHQDLSSKDFCQFENYERHQAPTTCKWSAFFSFLTFFPQPTHHISSFLLNSFSEIIFA